MPRDTASGLVVVSAVFVEVRAVVRDVEAQPRWVPQVTTAVLVEEYEDGTPATARFALSTPIGDDEYTLEYEHSDDAMSWVLVQGRMQRDQRGAYRLRDLGDGTTEVALDLEVEHSLVAPGFLRRKVFGGFVDGALNGLKQFLED